MARRAFLGAYATLSMVLYPASINFLTSLAPEKAGILRYEDEPRIYVKDV